MPGAGFAATATSNVIIVQKVDIPGFITIPPLKNIIEVCTYGPVG